MERPRIAVVMDVDLKKVFDEQRGLAKESTFGNHIMRQYFVQKGLLPEVQA